MNLIKRFRLFKLRWVSLLLGTLVCFTIVTLGITTLPSLGFSIQQALVGNYAGDVSVLPTGKIITPTATPGSTFEILSTKVRADGTANANGAVATAISPDQKTLLVLTSGYNKNFRNQTTGESITYPVIDPVTGQNSDVTTNKAEWIFVYDISSNKLVKKQQINIPNTFNGLAWSPDGQKFYISAGIDDRICVYRAAGNNYVPDTPFILLGHNSNQTAPFPSYDGGLLKNTPAAAANPGAVVAGIAVSKDGKTLVAANFENDSISVVDTTSRQVTKEIQLFKLGSNVATGEFPFDVAIVSDNNGAATKTYVSSQRDDEVLAVNLLTTTVTRIPVEAQPNKILLSGDQRRLYVANGNSDTVSVIDTTKDQVVQTISLARPRERYKGSIPNSLALSPDQKTLYVTLAGENAVAIVDINQGRVTGRIPTGWYPNSVSVSSDRKTLFVVNAKDNSGPNPSGGRSTAAGQARNTTFRNDYVLALQKAGIAQIPVPQGRTLAMLSQQVDKNNGFDNRRPDRTMRFLQGKIKHVVYIIKENRTYDQVLGDLPIGNGDPNLTLFPESISPNHHKLAADFVTFDNFYDSGSISGDGWGWSTFGQTTEYTEKTVSVLYGNAGFSGLTYDYEGQNRNVVVALPQAAGNPSPLTTRLTTLLDPSGNSAILPGDKDMAAPAEANNLAPSAIGGYLWDAALRAGKTVRGYGILCDLNFYSTSGDPTKPDPNNPLYIPISPTPFADGIPQAPAMKTSLQGRWDIYFRGYDQKNTDIYSVNEWKRDVEAYVQQNGTLPNLMMMALDHDHFGSFDSAVAGVNTPELQMADNDYAVGALVEYLSQRPEWKETAVFVIEDDAQDGPDHVDAHRSVAYVISPYTKRGVLVSTNYTTASMIRTMEDLLGIGYIGINDANAQPMSDAFTREANLTPYQAVIPGNLCQSPVDPNLVPACQDPNAPKSNAVAIRHDSQWWAKLTKDFNFEEVDNLNAEVFNRVLWTGIKGENIPYSHERNGLDLRQNREQLLKARYDSGKPA
ncbi:beta-propeller fold lactonase family protein [Halotia wernerae UHCC 0503]|nr:beta-propeller fold lactonase family protein [Halotia wernerae UHCC 0503]